MGKINVLGFDVANLIAAGEVVDRPASVVKELLENALDAGSTSVTVEIQNGGVSFIRVSDNGCGMDAEDLPVAVLRHATSKIKTAGDLEGIETLGFRGEALAAISSVARVRILSKTEDAEFGAVLECDGGSVVSVTETGCAKGTTVIVEELFFNVPARRKFLKKDSTETVAVTGVVEKIALSVPHVSVKYIADGEVRFMTAGDGDLLHTVHAVYGRQTAARMLAVDRTDNGIRIHGYISEPDNVRSNRNMENFFINGRYVKSRTAAAALEQAYVSRIPAEKFPLCVLNLELNPAAVDVNVHPAKLEVKFSNEKIIFDAVYYAVLSALESATQRPELKLRPTPAPAGKPASAPAAAVQPSRPQASAQNFWVSDAEARKLFGAFVPQSGERGPNVKRDQVKISSPGMQSAATPTAPERKSELPPVWEPPVRPSPQSLSEREPASPAVETEPSSAVPVTAAPTLENACPAAADAVPENAGVPEESRVPRMEPLVMLDEDVPLSDSETADTQTREIPDYVIVGEVYNCYVIVQLEDRILLIDKHAAHERIIFDQLCENMRSREKNAQLLMFPIHVDLTEAEVHALKEYREKIESIGFSFQAEAHGILLTEIPTEITRDSAPDMIMTLASRLADGTGSVESTEAEFFEARLYQASCKAAIKGGRLYSTENIRWLCDRLLRTPRDNETAIKTCPHGRPVAFEIRKNSIERQFSRLL